MISNQSVMDALKSNFLFIQSRVLFRLSDLFDIKKKDLDKSIHAVKISSLRYEEISDMYKTIHSNEVKKLIVASHSGRAGLNWVSRLLENPSSAVAVIEPFPFEESFFRFITWHHMEVDHGFVLRALKHLFVELWKEYDTIIYASPWINGGLEIIADEFSPDHFFTVIRDPRKTILSLVNKGWYQYSSNYISKFIPMPDKIFSEKHHYFSRIEPASRVFQYRHDHAAVGKASWYWNSSYKKIFEFIDRKYPDATVFKLEDIDVSYLRFQELCMNMGMENMLSEIEFNNSKKRIPNKGKPNNLQWSEQFESDFLVYADLFYASRYKTIITSV